MKKRKNNFKWYKFEKWILKSNSNLEFKNNFENGYGKKKSKIILIFLFIIADQMNFEKKKKMGIYHKNSKKPIPTNFQIAEYLNCSLSWVKKTKAVLFPENKNLENNFWNNQNRLKAIFGDMLTVKNKESKFETLFEIKNSKIKIARGSKDFSLLMKEPEQENQEINRNPLFKKSNWKVKKIFFTKNGKVHCRMKFYQNTIFNFDIGVKFLKSLFEKNPNKLLEKILTTDKFDFYFRTGWSFIEQIKKNFKIGSGGKSIKNTF